MSDQPIEEPMEPELDSGLHALRSEHGGMPLRSDDDYALAAQRDRVAAGLADYVPEDVPPATDPPDPVDD